MCSQENARTPQICPVSLYVDAAEMMKFNRPCQKCNHFERCSGYISKSNFRPFLPCIVKKIPQIWPVSRSQMVLNWAKTDHEQNRISSAKFQAIPPLCSKENVWKLQIWPVSLSQNPTKGKSTDHYPNLISSEGGQYTSACQISGHS